MVKKTNSSGTAKKRKTKARVKKEPNFKPTDHSRNYSQIAYEYAQEAKADKKRKKFCKWVRLAAIRFIEDLKKQRRRSYRYKFDPWYGNDICDFVEKFPHIEGTWDSDTIELEPPQIFILVNVFGWRRKSDDLRRFTSVYIEMARKGAKSTLTAAVAHYCLTCEGENGPQIIIGATTGAQALKVFDPAKKMADRTADYREAFNVKVWAKSITCEDNGGYIQTINSKSSTQDGWNPHCGILDELHAHKERGLYDVIKSAFGSRKNPLLWVITTAGYNIEGVCFEQRKLVTKFLEGIFEADHYFGIIYTLDKDDNEFDPKVWIKANPMLGITPTIESMESYAAEAQMSPASLGEFKTKRLNVWTSAMDGWINMELWKKGANPVNLDELEKYPCFGGLDLASTSDIVAFSLVWLVDGRLKVWGKYYVPEAVVKPRTEKGNVPYQVWVNKGFLHTTPGDVTDYAYIQKDIEDALDRFNIEEIAYDPWNAKDLVNRLLEKEAPMVEFRQGPKTFHPAMQAFELHVKGKTIDHGNNECLNWMASNIVARKDVNENMAPDKKKSPDKIDGIVSKVMATGRLIAHEQLPDSIYGKTAL